MNQEKFGNLIKEIRKRNNLTQKDLADKYHVTYQAVSKWERGINLPDISLIKEIASDYNVRLEDMMEGNFVKKKNYRKKYTLLISFLIIIIGIGIYFILAGKNSELHSRTIKTTCEDFNIYGIISYSESKSAIYIPKIEYCGNDKMIKFKSIDCTLYEKNDNIDSVISIESYNGEGITLDEFLSGVSFHVDNYLQKCHEYNGDNLYLKIKGNTQNSELFYTIPLVVEVDSCDIQPKVE